MPRISPSLICRARQRNPLLPPLLGSYRDLESAQNELRWLREHAIARANAAERASGETWQACLKRLCRERATGRPLQYVIGNQPFGALEILCEEGVLIPRSVAICAIQTIYRRKLILRYYAFRPETESITLRLAARLRDARRSSSSLRILDLCTGTGCISLLLHAQLQASLDHVDILGVDSSAPAISLADRNIDHNIKKGFLSQSARDEVHFTRSDMFSPMNGDYMKREWDTLIANPPYISPKEFRAVTARSVRRWEPKSALVPSTTESPLPSDVEVGDSFYPRLLDIAERVNAKLFFVEVADLDQAKRVAGLVLKQQRWAGCEIWKDMPDHKAECAGNIQLLRRNVPILGAGNGRAVLAWMPNFGESVP